MKQKLKEIKNLIKGDIDSGKSTLKKYSHDASLFEIVPEAVIYPKNSEDLGKLVKWVSKNKKGYPALSLTARSGGSDMTGGSINESIILDFTRYFNHIKKINSNFAVTEPGVYYRDFEKKTLEKGLIMPSFPASRELCAIGGMVANNAGGEKTLRYGKTAEYVKEVKAILSDGNEYTLRPLNKQGLENKMKQNDFEGEIYRQIYDLVETNYDLIQKAKPKVSKNSSGYYLWNVWDKETFDLTQLFVGSQGTLGLITEAKLKLIQPKPFSKLLVIFLKKKDVRKLPQVINSILSFRPETFEAYDNNTLKLAVKFIPKFIKKLKGDVFSVGLKFLPELKMLLTGGFPKFVMTAEFTGDTLREAEEAAESAEESLSGLGLKTRITKDISEAEKYKLIRRESFNLLRHKVKNKQTAPFIDDIVVQPKVLPEFLPRLEKILDQYPNITYTIAGHVGNGNFHIIPLMNLSDPRTVETISELGNKVYDLVFEYEGSMSAEHNDGLIRGFYMEKMFGPEIYGLFKQVKNIFDPLNIFNPNKKVGTDKEYVLKHIKNGG